jgi:hypothetical protein
MIPPRILAFIAATWLVSVAFGGTEPGNALDALVDGTAAFCLVVYRSRVAALAGLPYYVLARRRLASLAAPPEHPLDRVVAVRAAAAG